MPGTVAMKWCLPITLSSNYCEENWKMRWETVKVIGLPRAVQMARRWSLTSEMSPLNLKWSPVVFFIVCQCFQITLWVISLQTMYGFY